MWLVSFLLLLVALPAFGAGVSFEPRPLSSEAYGESYTAIADFSDGSFALLQYVFSNAGVGDGKAACRALVVKPDKAALNEVVRVDREQWSYQAVGNRLTVGKCVLDSTGKQTRFVAHTENARVELVFARKPDLIRPPGGVVQVDDEEFYAGDIVVPWAVVRGKITMNKVTTTSEGMGYMDHTRSNTRLPKIASRWLRFRGLSGAKKTLMEIRYSPEGKAQGWQWVEGKAAPEKIDLTGLRLSAQANALSFSIGAHRVSTSELLYSYEPVKEWGFVGWLAKPWVGNPETRTFRATLALADGQEIRGILEESRLQN